MKYCMRCGREFEGESSFCPECSAEVQPVNENRTEALYTQPNNQQVPPPSYQQTPPPPPQYQQAPQYQQVPPPPPYQQAPPYQQPPIQNIYVQAPYPPMEVDAPNIGFAILSFFFPMVGFVLWLVWKDKTPLKAKSCGQGALISTILSVVGTIFYIIFTVVVMVAASSSMYYYY